jgi:Ca2+-binding EF-hand superfamily protein
MKALIPISALAIALGSGAAYAGGNEHKSGSTAQFETLDRDSDQRLSQEEVQSDENVAGKFAALDVDGDGYVTKREYSARMKKDQSDSSTMDQTQRTPPRPDNPRDPY